MCAGSYLEVCFYKFGQAAFGGLHECWGTMIEASCFQLGREDHTLVTTSGKKNCTSRLRWWYLKICWSKKYQVRLGRLRRLSLHVKGQVGPKRKGFFLCNSWKWVASWNVRLLKPGSKLVLWKGVAAPTPFYENGMELQPVFKERVMCRTRVQGARCRLQPVFMNAGCNRVATRFHENKLWYLPAFTWIIQIFGSG